MSEIGEIIDYLQDEAGQDATIIWGNGTDPKLGDQISVTIIATGFDINPNRLFQPPVEMVELQSEESGFEINLEDDNFFMKNDPIVQRPEAVRAHQSIEKPKKKSRKEKKQLVDEANPENANVDGWFFRQFTKFFDDKDNSDTPVSEGNTNQ
jgi:cell division protein FtsZ